MTAPAPTPEEAAPIDRFGIFDEERVVEEVARAISWQDLDDVARLPARSLGRCQECPHGRSASSRGPVVPGTTTDPLSQPPLSPRTAGPFACDGGAEEAVRRVTPRAPTVIAVAAAVLTAASLTAIVGQAVAPDASGCARTQVSTVTRAERTDGGAAGDPDDRRRGTGRGVAVPDALSAPQAHSLCVEGYTDTPNGTRAAQRRWWRLRPHHSRPSPRPQPVTDEAADTPTTEAPSPDPAGAR
jgi:hypothetical protein